MLNTLEELLSGTGQGPYTPPTKTPATAYERGSYPSPEQLSTIQGFAGVKRDPKGNYGGFNRDQVKAFQQLYNDLTPDSPIKVDGIHGNQTAAAAYDLLTRYGGKKAQPSAAPAFTPTEASPLSFDEYTGRNPLNDMLEQFKPKKEISEERMNKAAGFAALGALLRNVVDANYGSQGAQIVQHTDPEWAMKLSKRYEQLKDQRKADELRYNMLRLQDGIRGRDRYDSYRDRIDERNMNNRDFATRQKFKDENKQYWYDRQRADRLSDYNRNKADQYTMMDKQTAKQKELARFNNNLQERAFERRLKKMRELGVTSTGKPANGSGGSGGMIASDGNKPFFVASVNGRNVPLTKGEFWAVHNWITRNDKLTKDDINLTKLALDGASKINNDMRVVQKYIGEYMQAQQKQASKAPQVFPSSEQSTTSGVPASIAIPNTVQLLMKRGMKYEKAQDAFSKMQANGIDDETAYNMLMQAED